MSDDTDRRQRRAGLAILSAIRPMIDAGAPRVTVLGRAVQVNYSYGCPLGTRAVTECVDTEIFWATRRQQRKPTQEHLGAL